MSKRLVQVAFFMILPPKVFSNFRGQNRFQSVSVRLSVFPYICKKEVNNLKNQLISNSSTKMNAGWPTAGCHAGMSRSERALIFT